MSQRPRPLQIAIVTPVYNDWVSFSHLLDALDRELSGSYSSVCVLAVDDGSSEPAPERLSAQYRALGSVQIIELATNLGHQRAIAIGLSEAAKQPFNCIIVMDADGEDRPEDVVALLRCHEADPSTIYVAERTKRVDPMLFKLCYAMYKGIFSLCTGKDIAHGNFCLIPRSKLSPIIHTSNTWNNLAASITRSRIPYKGIPTIRGSRYQGQSKMNFTALLLHGLSAVSVYLDVFAARVLTACVAMLATLSLLTLALVAIRLFTELAIPGWTTVVIGLLFVIMLQLLMLSSSVLFSLLYSRNQASTLPVAVAASYIARVRYIYGAEAEAGLGIR
jgi:hypothetical protein